MPSVKSKKISERFLNTIFDSINDPFSIMDGDYRIIRVNAAYARLKNIAPEELLGRVCFDVLHRRKTACRECVVEKTFKSKDPCAKEKRIRMPDGSEAWVEIYTYPIVGRSGAVSHVIEYTRDITVRKKTEEENKRLIEQLAHLSKTDSLTGLMNRRALVDELDKEVNRVHRYGAELSIILCDVDYFKVVNDTYGHAGGDRVLLYVADNLMNILRKTDIVGRYGGDEFMLILPGTPIKGAREIAERIRQRIDDSPYHPDGGNAIRLTMSFGVASFVPAMKDADTFIKWADTALYASKQAGRNRVHAIKL